MTATLVALLMHPAVGRSRISMDRGWRFYRVPVDVTDCDAAFPENLTDYYCPGLTVQAQIDTMENCRDTCCGDGACTVWFWCPANSSSSSTNTCTPATCFTGVPSPNSGRCQEQAGSGSIGFGRTVAPAPPPKPIGSDCDQEYCKPGFEDSEWRTVNVPHDFVVEGTFASSSDLRHGFLPYAKGWYRLHFVLPANMSNEVSWIDFDGVQRNSVAYLNGKVIGSHLSGYTSFRHYITKFGNFGGSNVLAVLVDATRPDSWWYDGGGIYRHVWLTSAAKLHVEPWGVYLPAVVKGPIGENLMAAATITARTTVTNSKSKSVNTEDLMAAATMTARIAVTTSAFKVKHVIRDDASNVLAEVLSDEHTLDNGAQGTFESVIDLKVAKLWSVEMPRLYSCETTIVVEDGKEIDVVHNTFGIRKMAWDADRGFLLNDASVKIKGFANHQDFAGVGVAMPDALQTYRVWRLKQMGSNGWRTAHHQHPSELLDECDRQGMLVLNEHHRNNPSLDIIEDLQTLVLRDRNHPSIIMWSLCNEALCESYNLSTARLLKPVIEQLDPLGQRPVSAAMNGEFRSEFRGVLDVVGINYHHQNYDEIHKFAPNQPMIGSETSSDFSDRQIYQNDPDEKMYVSAYDVNFPYWGATAEDAWCAIRERDFMAGGFYWTGFDYKGEPTPYGWPNVNSHFGVIDIAGFPKDNYYYHQSQFFAPEEQPMVHLVPSHWNWQEGKEVMVWAYTNGDFVELFLNGKSLGKRHMLSSCRHINWTVPFEAGELKAVAGRNNVNKLFAVDRVLTAGAATAVQLDIEWPQSGTLRHDGVDTALVTATIVDSNGLQVPRAMNMLNFILNGPGEIIGLGNGDPSSHEADKPTTPQAGRRSAWNGLARVVLQAGQQPGSLILLAEAHGLQPAILEITDAASQIADYSTLLIIITLLARLVLIMCFYYATIRTMKRPSGRLMIGSEASYAERSSIAESSSCVEESSLMDTSSDSSDR